jgi:hypothetical protein
MKQPRKIPADYDPFELFEDSMKLKFEGLDEEEEFFEENLC